MSHSSTTEIRKEQYGNSQWLPMGQFLHQKLLLKIQEEPSSVSNPREVTSKKLPLQALLYGICDVHPNSNSAGKVPWAQCLPMAGFLWKELAGDWLPFCNIVLIFHHHLSIYMPLFHKNVPKEAHNISREQLTVQIYILETIINNINQSKKPIQMCLKQFFKKPA